MKIDLEKIKAFSLILLIIVAFAAVFVYAGYIMWFKPHSNFTKNAYACPDTEDSPVCFSVLLETDCDGEGSNGGCWINEIKFPGGKNIEVEWCDYAEKNKITKATCHAEGKIWYVELKRP